MRHAFYGSMQKGRIGHSAAATKVKIGRAHLRSFRPNLDTINLMATTNIEMRRTQLRSFPTKFGHEKFDGDHHEQNMTDQNPKLSHDFGHAKSDGNHHDIDKTHPQLSHEFGPDKFDGNHQDKNKTDRTPKLSREFGHDKFDGDHQEKIRRISSEAFPLLWTRGMRWQPPFVQSLRSDAAVFLMILNVCLEIVVSKRLHRCRSATCSRDLT